MRQRYLVTYDVCDAKRLRAVFRIMKGYGSHLQLSVFRCDLNEMQLVQMKAELVAVMDVTVDGVLIVDVGPSDGRGALAFETLGKGKAMPEPGARIV